MSDDVKQGVEAVRAAARADASASKQAGETSETTEAEGADA